MGNRLRMLRNESHISLRTLSKYTHITNPVLSYLENGVRPFRQTHIDILCSFFNVTSDYLLGRTDNGLFVHTQIGEDELLLNESEYNNLSPQISVSVISVGSESTITVTTNKQVVNIAMPSHRVYRELKGKIADHNLVSTLQNKYLDLSKRMSQDDLKNAIDFIEKYILHSK